MYETKSKSLWRRMAALCAAAVLALTACVQCAYAQEKTVIPLGQAVGIKLFANGVLVVDVSALEGVGGKSPAQKCGNHKSGLRLRNRQIQLAIAGTSPPLVANIGKYFGRVIDQR